MRTLLVTGATGFIGRHLQSAMAEWPRFDYEVVLWDRRTMGDLLSRSDRDAALRTLKPRAVLHLAWASTNSDGYQDDPLNSSWGRASSSFLRECIDEGTWFIAIGSAADDPRDHALNSHYSLSKRALRLAFDTASRSNEITLLRPQYVVSFEDQRPRVVRAYLQNRLCPTFELKQPDAVLDFIHVSDVVSGILTAINNQVLGTVELGSGYLHSVAQLVSAAEMWAVGGGGESRRFPGANPSPTKPQALLQLVWRPTHTEAMFSVAAT